MGQLEPMDQHRRIPVAEALIAAVRVAVTGSATLALLELGAALWNCAKRFERPWPPDVILAAYGKLVVTHLLVWTPLVLGFALILALWVSHRSPFTVHAMLSAGFVAVTVFVVVTADLAMIQRRELAISAIALVGGGALVTAAVALAVVHLVERRLGYARFRMAANIVTCLAALLIGLAATVFAWSPFLDPGGYREAPLDPSGSRARAGPDVLWIVLDTARADHLSCYSRSCRATPFLGDWAQRSIVYDHAVSGARWTLPAHASMFSGLSIREHGASVAHQRLDSSIPTVAAELADAGYSTAAFSANPLIAPHTGLSRGFDTCVVVDKFRYLGHFSLQFLAETWGITPVLPWLDSDRGAALTNHQVARWLDSQRTSDAPVLLFVNYMEAHLPRRVPKPYRAMYLDEQQLHRSYDLMHSVYGEIGEAMFLSGLDCRQPMTDADREILRRLYEAGIRYLDDRVRELMEIFEERRSLENTFVVITADHGDYLDTHGMWGHEFQIYQDLLSVPLMIREPGRKQGKRVSIPVHLADLYPTILNFALGRSETGPGHDSRDLLALAADPAASRIVISQYCGPNPGQGELVQNIGSQLALHRASPQTAAQDERYKYIVSDDGTRELYDLLQDPGELHNLIDELPGEAEHLDAYIRSWLETTRAYVPPTQGEEAVSPQVLNALRSLGYVGDD